MKSILPFILLTLLLTQNIISQWIPQNPNTSQRLLSIFFLDENLGWAGGNEGCILKTTDGGNNWDYYSIGTKYTVHAVHFVDSLKGWVALYTFTPNRAGYIMATSDGGINWSLQYSVEGFTLHNVYFYDQYFGWAVGSGGIFLRTVDGGTTWQEAYASPQWSWSLYFVSPNIGWVGDGSSGYIRKTTDGGYSWQFKSVPSYSRMMDIDFINENVGWAAGQYGHILKTTNGGETWNHLSSLVSLELNDIDFVDENNGWVVGLSGVILHTTNGGITWAQQGSNTTNDLYSLSCIDSEIGWVAGDQGLILTTENGGIPVELISFSADYINSKIKLSWITATELNNSGFEIERKAGKDNWQNISFVAGNGTTTEPTHYSFFDDVHNLDGSKLFYRLKQIDFDGTFEYSNTIEVEIAIPDNISLYQNFPNPFNPSTTIKYSISNIISTEGTNLFAILKVYDVLGKEVATLVNGEKPAGNYEVEFSANKISCGVYYYQLRAGDFVETKKMILMK